MARLAPLVVAATSCLALAAQQADLSIVITGKGDPPALTVPDFRGDAHSQPLMRVFNETLWRDLDLSSAVPTNWKIILIRRGLPDGRHLVFVSNRSGASRIWSMPAGGTHLRQLTTQGINTAPVWGK